MVCREDREGWLKDLKLSLYNTLFTYGMMFRLSLSEDKAWIQNQLSFYSEGDIREMLEEMAVLPKLCEIPVSQPSKGEEVIYRPSILLSERCLLGHWDREIFVTVRRAKSGGERGRLCPSDGEQYGDKWMSGEGTEVPHEQERCIKTVSAT